jgi:hypothetical protein
MLLLSLLQRAILEHLKVYETTMLLTPYHCEILVRSGYLKDEEQMLAIYSE